MIKTQIVKENKKKEYMRLKEIEEDKVDYHSARLR